MKATLKLTVGLGAGSALFAMGLLARSADAGEAPIIHSFPDAHEAPPADWKGKVFKLSADYPTSAKKEPLPWKKFNFKTQPEQYMMAVLDYCLEGQRESDWVAQNNPVRKWYHAPWLHWGLSGREFINGHTMELAAGPFKLGPNQKRAIVNNSIGVYNDIAAVEFGRVWRDPMNPKLDGSKFAEGAATFKLLHVNATDEELPFLKGSPSRDAYLPINPGGVNPDGSVDQPSPERAVQKVRLMQIDIAVRDDRNDDATGWLFGTFVYDGNQPGNDPYKKLVPVGMMWGNSPQSVAGPHKEEWINPKMKLWEWRQDPGMGFMGRMNGPLDSPNSACSSCHGTAQFPMQPMTPSAFDTNQVRMEWFKNVPAGKTFRPGGVSSDYSLQMSMGLMNFFEWKAVSQTQRSPEALTPDSVVPLRFAHGIGAER